MATAHGMISIMGVVENEVFCLPASIFGKTRSILGRPKIAARLSPILSMYPGRQNGLRDAFQKPIPTAKKFHFPPLPL